MRTRLVIAPGHVERLARVGVDSVRAALAHGGGRVVVENRTSVVRLLNDPEDPAFEVYLKCYWSAQSAVRWRYAFRRCRARREYESLLLMRELGIPGVEPLAWGSVRGALGRLFACFVATRGVPRAVGLDALMRGAEDPRSPAADRALRRRGIETLGAAVGAMHRAGYVDHDLHWRNVLVTLDAGTPDFRFVDSPKGERPLSAGRRRRGVIEDLASLDRLAPGTLSVRERLRFFRAWRGDRRLDGDDRRLLAAVAARTAAMEAKRARKAAEHEARGVDVDAWEHAARVRRGLIAALGERR